MGKRKDSKTLSVVKINLASHAEDDGSDPFTTELKFKKSKTPANLVIVIKTQWLKVNDKDALGSSQDLDADSDSGGSDDEKPAKKAIEEDEDIIDEDEGSVELSDLSDEDDEPKDGLSKKIDILEHECYERGKVIRRREVQVVKLKGKVRKLKDEAADGKKWKEKAAKLKSLKKEKLAALRDLEQTIALQKKELAQYKAGKGGELSSSLEKDLIATKAELQELKQANEKLKNEDKKMQELKELKEQTSKMRKEKEQKDKEVETLRMEVVKLRRELHERRWSISVRTSVSTDEDEVKGPSAVMGRARRGTDPETGRLKRTLETVKKDKEELDLIVEAVYDVQEYTFDSNNVPLSAKKISETLTSWKVFSGDLRTNAKLLDSIVNAIGTSLRIVDPVGMGYWLNTACHLLQYLKKDLHFDYLVHDHKPSPAARFAQELIRLVKEGYRTMLDTACDELQVMLSPAILQQPSVRTLNSENTWSCTVTFIIPVLDKFLEATVGNHLFESVTEQFFSDLMSFIDHTLFNELITTKSLCTCSNAFQIKLELSQFEQWLTQSLKIPDLRSRLDHIAQAANVLVMDKSAFVEKETRGLICPSLNVIQIKRLMELFTPDKLSPDPVPRSLLEQLNGEVKSLDMRKDHTLLPPWKESDLNLAFPVKTGKKESDKDLREKEK